MPARGTTNRNISGDVLEFPTHDRVGMLAALWAVFGTVGHAEGAHTGGGVSLGRIALVIPFLPLLGDSFGWIFTEMGRQPWVVFGIMQTKAGVSPTSSVGLVGTSLVVFTLLYGILAVVEFDLIRRAVRLGPPEDVPDPFLEDEETGERQLSITY